MESNKIRKAYLQFFQSKQHQIVSSAPMVVKNDPTLMFTNAGMNQFKDLFLGNSAIKYPRIANSQKCLRVSGKHNDLEEVGLDTYHHTMFEMLGNWSFGDYFKKEAIAWAWEFLTEVMKIDKNRMYVTIFEGDPKEGVERDNEAFQYWSELISKDRILLGNKKDNFWEMGESGPCGPCSEIHCDIRSDEERKKVDGKELVNQSHPQVIEIWNLVFIQYNRRVSGELEKLSSVHVDTGMGFERLCMVVQGKQSNYDTDVFQNIIAEIARLSGKHYGKDLSSDIAMRVIADHIRAISFSIADGQLPSNNKAGYVIRRILRRAVRYAYTYLGQEEPFICKIIPTLVNQMGEAYPELKAQEKLIVQVVSEEENSFLRTLSSGIKLLEQLSQKAEKEKSKVISGKDAFELYDTFGFPLDLTELILREKNMSIDHPAFEKEMEAQKERSRNAAVVDTDDWISVMQAESTEFVGYDKVSEAVKICRYRKVSSKGKTLFHLVLDKTPFYGESGGQMGDTGILQSDNEKIKILDTQKENNLIIHLTDTLPSDVTRSYQAIVDVAKRNSTAGNHTATHLLHLALRKVLGTHVEQKGSLVGSDFLRFDFVHFQKMTAEEIAAVEAEVNALIRKNIVLKEHRNLPIADAQKMGAMALFGEKYGEQVRVICYGDSVELCGGTHVQATGNIGFFKILSESAIAAGIRRIEAISGESFEKYLSDQNKLMSEIKELLKTPQDIKKSVENILLQNVELSKQIEQFSKEKINSLSKELVLKIKKQSGLNILTERVVIDSVQSLKDLAYQIKNQTDNLFLVLGAEIDGKANLAVALSDNLTKEKNLNAGNIIRELSKEIDGGGGGQASFATAGGKKPAGIDNAIKKAFEIAGNL